MVEITKFDACRDFDAMLLMIVYEDESQGFVSSSLYWFIFVHGLGRCFQGHVMFCFLSFLYLFTESEIRKLC